MVTNPVSSPVHTRPAEILQKLIQFDTTNPPGDEAACITYIRGLLSDAGIESTILAKTPNRPNLIARIKGAGNAKPILMYGHVDVVTTENQKWDHPPFEGKIVANAAVVPAGTEGTNNVFVTKETPVINDIKRHFPAGAGGELPVFPAAPGPRTDAPPGGGKTGGVRLPHPGHTSSSSLTTT